MREIYNAILERLQREVPELRFIDINVGQMDEEDPPVDYPCALIDIDSIDFERQTKGYDKGECQLDIDLYFLISTTTSSITPESVRGEAFKHIDTVNKVDRVLNKFETNDFYPLKRKRFTRLKKYSPRGYRWTYTCRMDQD